MELGSDRESASTEVLKNVPKCNMSQTRTSDEFQAGGPISFLLVGDSREDGPWAGSSQVYLKLLRSKTPPCLGIGAAILADSPCVQGPSSEMGGVRWMEGLLGQRTAPGRAGSDN